MRDKGVESSLPFVVADAFGSFCCRGVPVAGKGVGSLGSVKNQQTHHNNHFIIPFFITQFQLIHSFHIRAYIQSKVIQDQYAGQINTPNHPIKVQGQTLRFIEERSRRYQAFWQFCQCHSIYERIESFKSTRSWRRGFGIRIGIRLWFGWWYGFRRWRSWIDERIVEGGSKNSR